MNKSKTRRGEIRDVSDVAVLAGEWGQYWDHTLGETWAGPAQRYRRAQPRNHPTRGTRTDHDLGTLDHRRDVLPLAAYDMWRPGETPRMTITRLLDDGGNTDGCETYPMELCLSPADVVLGHDGWIVQETRPARLAEVEAAAVAAGHYLPFASVVFGETTPAGPVVIASAVDKTERGWTRYTAVAPSHRGRGLAGLLHVLILECGAPLFRWSEGFQDFEARENLIQLGMLRPMLRAHASTIHRAVHRGVNVPAHVVESANNWEELGERIMATAKAKTKQPAAGMGMFGSAEDRAKRKEERAKRKAAARPKSGVTALTESAIAAAEELRTATAEAREVLAELQKATKKN